jgi:putative Ca2+/H+ antiporter (TMEM165/GDT1 family)
MQNGYCFAIALSLFNVSSSGGSTATSSCIFFESGCRTILAVGNAVSGEEALVVVLFAGTILGFIFLEVLKVMNGVR